MAKPRKQRFVPTRPEKYRGDVSKIVSRSSWELKVMDRLDRDPNVVWWSSETTIVPYNDRLTGKTRRYYPDFLYCRRLPGGGFEVVMAEVKPSKESPRHVPQPVRRRGKSEKTFMREAVAWSRNRLKWEAAEKLCAAKGWRFVVLTEKQIGVKA